VVDPVAHPEAGPAHHALHAAPRLSARLQPGPGQPPPEGDPPRPADLAPPRRCRHPQLRLDGAAGRQRSDQLAREVRRARSPGPQAHVQRVRRARRHRAHLPALHGALALRDAGDHPARSRPRRPQPGRIRGTRVLARGVSPVPAGSLRRLSPRLRSRRQLLRHPRPPGRLQGADHAPPGRPDRRRRPQLAGGRRPGRDALRGVSRLHCSLGEADEPRHARARRMSVSRVAFLTGIVLLYAFLIAPILIVVIASLNAGRFLVFPPDGLSFQWYVNFARSGPFVRSFFFSLRLAALTTTVATVIGTAAALYVVRHARRNDLLRMLLVAPLQLPGIMTALALLIFYYAIGLGGTSYL